MKNEYCECGGLLVTHYEEREQGYVEAITECVNCD